MASHERQELRIVAGGRDLVVFRQGLKVGQLVRGRVLAMLSGDKIILNVRGYNLIAEIRGLKIGCGQTLSLVVTELANKIRLKWLRNQEIDSNGSPIASSLTLSKLLGSLHRIQRVILDKATDKAYFALMKGLCDRIGKQARRGPIFLPKFQEHKPDRILPGETTTRGGGLPSILRVFTIGSDEHSEIDHPWFQFCLESANHGPMIFSISRNNGGLIIELQVLDKMLPEIGKTLSSLKTECSNAGFGNVQIEAAGINQDYPEILTLLDRYSEEFVNCRI